ncbi:MAG: chlorophyll synthase ChlG [Pseudomonadota bacterium]
MSFSDTKSRPPYPRADAVLELIKPITWFPPMWAYLCGIVSSGVPISENLVLFFVGLLLAGPIVCGMSQAANDWCDRFVDAINEPNRPIPSGRVPGHWGLWIALGMSVLALAIAPLLGPWGFGATFIAVLAAWAYSAEPIRAKRSGWWGPGLVALCYEGLPWITGVAVLSSLGPNWQTLSIALLYAAGAHGIMTLNDFKALEGDRETGLRSLPVVYGPKVAARIACVVMAVPQVIVIALLSLWGAMLPAAVILLLLIAQLVAMRTLLRDPKGRAPWYNGVGVGSYVMGMMAAAIGLRMLNAGGFG